MTSCGRNSNFWVQFNIWVVFWPRKSGKKVPAFSCFYNSLYANLIHQPNQQCNSSKYFYSHKLQHSTMKFNLKFQFKVLLIQITTTFKHLNIIHLNNHKLHSTIKFTFKVLLIRIKTTFKPLNTLKHFRPLATPKKCGINCKKSVVFDQRSHFPTLDNAFLGLN